MKKIYLFALIVFAFSCDDEVESVLDENFIKGGFVQFTADPDFSAINAFKVEEFTFSMEVEDLNKNATEYSLALIHNDIRVEDFVTLTSFPNTLSFTGTDILNALALAPADINVDTRFDFVAKVTTPGGVSIGTEPDFDFNTNTSTGGSTTSNVTNSAFGRDAMDFTFTFFLPPPKKLRGTSFEEPFAGVFGEDYTRPSSEADVTGQLMNNSGERHVMHVAVGTGVDDEIGFITEFVNTGGSGFTSEEIGVSSETGEVGAYIDGSQGYQLEDVDGLLRITFDRVPVDISTNPISGVRIQYFLRATGHELDDTLIISAILENAGGTETIELLNIDGDDMDNGLEDQWNLVDSGFLENSTAYTLVIEAAVESGNEDIYFDEMLVYIAE